MTVNGGGTSRVILVDPHVTASISGMTIDCRQCVSVDAGVTVDNFRTLTVSDSAFASNAGHGGGILTTPGR